MKLEMLLSRLKKARRTANGQWVACCPAHDDKSPSLAVKAVDGTILLHCFGGCSVEEVLGAVEMTVSDLYPDTGKSNTKQHRISTKDALQCLSLEAMVVSATANTMNKRALKGEELARLRTAVSRINAAYALSGVA